MPELPEVETVVRDLRPHLIGRSLTSIRFGRKRLRRGFAKKSTAALTGCRVKALTRRGKWITVELCTGRLLVHLGMTGQLTVGPPDRPSEPHIHVVIDLDDGSQLRFRDERRFGSFDYFADAAGLAQFLDDRLGPEPFDTEPVAWRDALKATRRAVKAVLLDQAVVAGVGNIYADEALFLSGLHPLKVANRLTRAQAERLRLAIPEVLTVAIERRGSSIRNYMGGGFQSEFRVYGRTGEPCPACDTAIKRVIIGGRSSHFCPRCQRRR